MLSTNAARLEKLVKREDLSTNEIIELLASHDSLTKKLTCNYLIDRSASDSDLGLLTANLLVKNCNDPNPSIRSSCLLALSSLPGMEEAAVKVLDKCISDPSTHVTRICPTACTLLQKQAPESLSDSGLIGRLYESIRSPDPMFVSESLVALNDILSDEGGIIVNKRIAHHLLSRLSSFDSCNLAYVLNILLYYSPKSEEEVFAYLNMIDFCFMSSSSAIINAAIKLFIQITKEHQNLVVDMLETIKGSICKILNQNNPENSFLLFKYLESLKLDLKLTFASHYKFFLLRAKDPTYLKHKKLFFLPLVANEENITDIITEVKHFIADFQSFKPAFICLSQLGSLNDDSVVQVLIIITPLLKNPNEQVVISALKCLLCLVMSAPQERALEIMSESLIKNLNYVVMDSNLQEEDPLLLLYLLTIFSPFLKDTQECFEHFDRKFNKYDVEIKCRLIKAAAVNFLSWPASLQPILGSILSKALSSDEHLVSSQAAFIYASLHLDANETSTILSVGPFTPKILKIC